MQDLGELHIDHIIHPLVESEQGDEQEAFCKRKKMKWQNVCSYYLDYAWNMIYCYR